MGDQPPAAGASGAEPGRFEATQEAPVAHPGARSSERGGAQAAGERRRSTYFDRWDLFAIITFAAVAFILRFFSPLLPNIFLPGNQGPALTNCVSSTPIDPVGDPGTLCGLAYPFNRGYADANGVLQPPDGQVFDEVYFPVDAYYDVKGMENCRPTTKDCQYNYFDPEPPLAKEIIAAGEWGYGWYRAHFQGAQGDYIDLGFNTFGWRIAACIFGSLCVPMMYLLARRLWSNRLFPVAAATFVCFDGMFFIQSRIGMIDIFPIFFILCAYFLYLVHTQSRTVNGSVVSMLALGFMLGIGIASKWIVLAAYASIVFLLVMRIVRRQFDVRIGPSDKPWWVWGQGEGPAIPGEVPWQLYAMVSVIALVAVPLFIYAGSWFPFFWRGQFQSLGDVIKYNVDSYRYHATLTATHPFGSPWWSWPLVSRPVLYYAEYSGLGKDAWTGQPLISRMADMGNPWIWWASLPCLASLPYFMIRHKSLPATLIFLGFLSQYLPWSRVTRVLFMYHMFGGLIFMVLALAFVLTYLASRLPRPGPQLLVGGFLAVTVFFFGYFYPVWTGLPISEPAYFSGHDTPPWGPKVWLTNCNYNLPESKPQLFCWN